MIPELPPSCSDEDALKFYRSLLGRLQDQSSLHVNWHTHRANPSVCWICDLSTLSSIILGESERLYSKSAIDIETEQSSEEVSEPEIEK